MKLCTAFVITFLSLAPIAKATTITAKYYSIYVVQNVDTVLLDQNRSRTPIPSSTYQPFADGTEVKITYEADDQIAFAKIQDTPAPGAKAGASSFSVTALVEYTYSIVETKPTPVPVTSVPLKTSYDISAGCGVTNNTEYAISGASYSLGLVAGGNDGIACDSRKFGSSNGNAIPGRILTGYFSASASTLMRFDLQAGLDGGTLAMAYADPDIQIDPTFAYADDFRVVSGDSPDVAPVPEPGSLWLCTSALMFLPILGKHRKRS